MGFNSTQLAQAASIMQIGGAVSSAAGSFFGAGTQRANLRGQAAVADANARIFDTNARIHDVNARMAEVSAQSAMSQGQKNIAGLTLKAGQLKSSQRANLAANGIDLGEGSAAEIQASTDIMKDIDVGTLKANAVRTAWGYRTQGINASMQALNAGTQASNSRIDALTRSASASGISPFGSAATSLLGSAGNVASTWYQYSKATQ